MFKSPAKLLIAGQLIFWGGLLVCVLIRPDVVTQHNWPLSAYGTFKATLLPFALSFMAAITTLLLASRQVKADLAHFMRITAAMLSGLLVLPYKPGTVFIYLHVAITILLWLFSVYVCVNYISKLKSESIFKVLLVGQLAGLVLIILSIGDSSALRLHAVGEFISGLAFAVILVSAATKKKLVQVGDSA